MNADSNLPLAARLAITLILGFLNASVFAQSSRPNILLVVADDLGWADVGWHNGFAKTRILIDWFVKALNWISTTFSQFVHRLARR